MATYRKLRVFNFPFEWAVPYMMDNLDGEMPYDLKELDNVTQWEVVEEKEVDGKRVGKKRWCAHSEIPKFAQHIVKPDFLTFFENSVWDRKAGTYSFSIEPMAEYLKTRLDCHGKTVYRGIDGKTERVFEIFLTLKIPIIGMAVEKWLVDKLGQNEKSDFKLTGAGLEKAYKRKLEREKQG